MFYVYIWVALQIIIEMAPISSSGHLLLFQTFVKKYCSFDIIAFFEQKKINLKTIYYLLHAPTLFIILCYFSSQWYSFIFHNQQIFYKPIVWVIIADLITVILYMLLQRITITLPIQIGFLITALCLLSTKWCGATKSIFEWHYMDACILGLAQACAVLPGISRLGLTCAVGCMLGFSLIDAFSLSWLLYAPLMGAACIYSLQELVHYKGHLKQILNCKMGLVILISSGMSWYLLKAIVFLANTQALYLFGWYMLIPLILWGFCK